MSDALPSALPCEAPDRLLMQHRFMRAAESIGGQQSDPFDLLLRLNEGVQLWDVNGHLLFANPVALRYFNLTPDDEVDSARLVAACRDENGELLASGDFPVNRVLRGECPVDARLVQVDSASGTRWLRLTAHVLPDADGRAIAGATCGVQDVSSLVERGLRLAQQAHFDALTGLPNRILLADRLKIALAHAQRSGEMLAVCLVDLDGFKAINDTLGHKAGDQLLQEIAQRLTETLRADDTAARIGGDEFVLLLGKIKAAGQCEQTLRRVLDAVAAPMLIGGTPAGVSASIGVTLYPGDVADPDQMLRHADQAMYKAKEAGKNRFHLFDPTIESRLRANQGILKRIEAAIGADQFCLYYQPIIDCRHGRVEGFEALLRWKHPVLGLRTPGEFLPLIEHEEVIVRIGEWALEKALHQMTQWRAAGIATRVALNFSPHQFLRGNFATRLGERLATHPPELARQLEIEIVESAALEDTKMVGSVIEHYKHQGVRFALDDFGTGYSTLAHFRRLPVNALKIDQSFVRNMLDNAGDLAIVQGVVGLAAAFQRDVVAEGVESIEQVLMLLELGCDVMQGYGLARPMSAERVPGWLAEFQADPRWRLARSNFPLRIEFDLLLMEVAHRHWMEHLRQAASGKAETGTWPETAYEHCRLSQWHAGSGKRSFGYLPEFQRIDTCHRRVHHLADTLRACALAGHRADTQTTLEQLDRENEILLQCLHGFRVFLTDHVADRNTDRKRPSAENECA